jgi:hypothetical protein
MFCFFKKMRRSYCLVSQTVFILGGGGLSGARIRYLPLDMGNILIVCILQDLYKGDQAYGTPCTYTYLLTY